MLPHILFVKHFFTLFGKETLLPNMLPSISLKMLLLATVALFLMSMPAAFEARRILHGEEQNVMKKNQLLLESSLQMQGNQVPPISVSMPNPPPPPATAPLPQSAKRPPSLVITLKSFLCYEDNLVRVMFQDRLQIRALMSRPKWTPPSPSPYIYIYRGYN